MRTLQRATLATMIATGIASAAAPGIAQTTQNFPTRPVRLIVPFTAGSATDLLARTLLPYTDPDTLHVFKLSHESDPRTILARLVFTPVLYVAITALTRFLVVDIKDLPVTSLLVGTGSILVLSLAVLVLQIAASRFATGAERSGSGLDVDA